MGNSDLEDIALMNTDDARTRARIADLLKKRAGTATVLQIRDGLYDLVQQAVPENDIEALALLASWFVLVSEDSTIARFRIWMERGGPILSDRQPPSNGIGGPYG